MKQTLLSLLLLFGLLPFGVYAQTDYYDTYTSIHYGSKLKDGGSNENARFCQVKTESNIVRYSPYEVKEYGFSDGRVYQARDIQVGDSVRRVFLERLVTNGLRLYFYQGSHYRIFYLEKDSGHLIPLPKRDNQDREINYKEILSNNTRECDILKEYLYLINYHARPLTTYVEAYNTCEAKEFPYFKYGFMVGYVNTRLLIPSNVALEFLKDSEIKADGSFTFSLFTDFPIGKKGLSVHPEIQYTRNNFDYYRINSLHEAMMAINTSCITLPLMARYTMLASSAKFRPYLNAGGTFSWLIKNETTVLETALIDQGVVIEKYSQADIMTRQYFGYITGIGLQMKFRHRINLYAELRYGNSYAVTNNSFLNKGEFYVLTGLNF